jgi:hypothetical protein
MCEIYPTRRVLEKLGTRDSPLVCAGTSHIARSLTLFSAACGINSVRRAGHPSLAFFGHIDSAKFLRCATTCCRKTLIVGVRVL